MIWDAIVHIMTPLQWKQTLIDQLINVIFNADDMKKSSYVLLFNNTNHTHMTKKFTLVHNEMILYIDFFHSIQFDKMLRNLSISNQIHFVWETL